MRILYAIQGTGNGHLSRAETLYPYLQELGSVDFFLSGNNSTLQYKIPIKYKSKGWSLHYGKCGDLNYTKIALGARPYGFLREAQQLPLHQYDMVINDFDFITKLACKLQNKKVVHFGHQASFASDATPRPIKKSISGEIVLKKICKCTS